LAHRVEAGLGKTGELFTQGITAPQRIPEIEQDVREHVAAHADPGVGDM
jgi:hypothetical protein